ncbi:TetR/AcrR family transcriptional regulator [Embleya scabrispora]|uniref:TetR/AcrR family transcriptional regulator n=1 Tax=Embleya scabrispora TaxID=159449 RepID=UPI00037EADFB|nr:TetR/AcrR family transcriptional regulator [Embleya scabrispora]MYS78910.1 TetR family transcriptional regulator [Streptomyces sp. SID5474]
MPDTEVDKTSAAVDALRRPAAAPAGRGGRPRDAHRDAQIMRAALDVLIEIGYDRLTMDAVATRARAGKATLYRRWPSKEALIAEAALCAGADSTEAVPDTGSLRGDLITMLAGAAEHIDESHARAVVALLPILPGNPELAEIVRERFLTEWQRLLQPLLARGRERGEVHPDRDLDLLALVLPSMAFYQTVFAERPVDPPLLTRLIDEILLPLAASPPHPRTG